MSDLLIRGIEMPKDGHWGTVSIPFYIHGDGSVSDSKGHIIGSAVPVPPHGRLIDADALYEDCVLDHNYEVAATTTRINEYMQLKIDAAPTIIPAEEGA